MNCLRFVTLALAAAIALVPGVDASGAGVAATAGPVVRVHGGGTWTPDLELALDEVHMTWTGEPRRAAAPPTLVDGASVLHVDRDGAAVKLLGIATVADLVARARALRDVNPAWDAHLVLYTPGERRSARSRRVLSGEVVIVSDDGTASRERGDPLGTLDVIRAIGQRNGVARVEAVAEAPDYVRQRLARKIAKLQRQDQPGEAQEFFARKRLPPGQSQIPVERYLQAREHMKQMPIRSTVTGTTHPAAAALGLSIDAAAALVGSWTPLGPGNVGGRTRALVIDPRDTKVIYAGGVAGGVWKTTNGGRSWRPLTDTLLPNLAIAALAMDPANPELVYAGTGEGVFNIDAVRGAGIFKTSDAGATWSRLSSTADSNFFFVNKIVIRPDGTVLAATRTGVWRSTNGGRRWSRTLDGADVRGCFDIASAPRYVLVSCGTFAMGSVYRSTNGGATFVPVLGRLVSGNGGDWAMGRTSIAVAPSDPRVAYVLASSSNVDSAYYLGLDALYKSTDGGLTWTRPVTSWGGSTKLNTLLLTNPLYANLVECGFGVGDALLSQGWYDNVIAVDPTDPRRVWAGGIDLFRSDDGGLNWALASFWWTGDSPGAFVHADQHAIVFAPDYARSRMMYVANDGGIFRTTNGAHGHTTTNPCTPAGAGIVWTELNNNYGVTQFYHGLPYPGPSGGDTFLGGTQDNGTIRGTVGGGSNVWTQIFGGDGGYVAVDPGDTNVLYAATPRGDFWKSTDGGANFGLSPLSVLDSFIFIPPLAMSPNDSSVLWTGSRYMWRTTDAMVHWTGASQFFTTSRSTGRVTAIAVAPGDDNLVLAGGETGGVFRTTEAMTTTHLTFWAPVWPINPGATPAINGYVSWIAFDPSDASTVYLTYSTFGVPHVWKSVDGGQTWSNIDGSGTAALPDVPVHTIVVDPAHPERLFVGTDVGVFSSADGGARWAVESTGFANVITEALALGKVGDVDTLFAFTHGRGAWRVSLRSSPADIGVSVARIANGTSVAPGGTVVVSNTVRNFGELRASAPVVVGFALVPVDATGRPSGSEIRLGARRTVAALEPHAASPASTPVLVPASAPDGSYRIRVIADASHHVIEDHDATNNTRLTSVFTIVR